MKKHLSLLVLLVTVCASLQVSAQIETPIPSPAGSVSSRVGLTDVEINYFRPSLKGREVFGEGDKYLQPYGQLWRAGANSGSVLKISTDITIDGKKVPAGEYLIYLTPGKSEWKFMLYSDLSLGGNVGGYDEANEVLEVMVKPVSLNRKVESLTYLISDIAADSKSAAIEMQWENTSVKIPFSVDFDAIVMAQIKEFTQVNPRNLLAAANYYYTTDKDLDQALTWVNEYLSTGDNSNQFWNIHLKAKILAKMGNKKEAIATAKESIELAKKSPQGDFGYIKRNEDLIASLK